MRDEFYRAKRSTAGTKTDTLLSGVPQSNRALTREQIDDQQMTSIAEVVSYVPSIGTQPGKSNRDHLIFRGNSSSADFFLNGIRDDVQYLRDVYRNL